MNYIEYGKQNKEIIILLHGGGLSWWNYKSEAELLKDRFHVVLPVLDGHADSDSDFISIEENARRLISFIDKEFGGSVFLIGGLSLGAQILAEMLSQRPDICRYAVIESASVISSRVTGAMISPVFSASYGLIRKKWFAKMQFRYLRIREDLFDDYFKDTSKITKTNMTAFLKASALYELKPEIRNTSAEVRITVGKKEQRKMIRSVMLLHESIPKSSVEIRKGYYHGDYSVNYPDLYVKDIISSTNKQKTLNHGGRRSVWDI